VRGPAVAASDVEGGRRPGEWLEMGDIGRIDAGGRLIIEGRADRVIVTGGVNVHPDAVEAVLAGHPGLSDVHVLGEPDPEWGTAVVAEIVPAVGAGFDEAAVTGWAKARLAGHQVPKRWRVVEHIERTELGKRPG